MIERSIERRWFEFCHALIELDMERKRQAWEYEFEKQRAKYAKDLAKHAKERAEQYSIGAPHLGGEE